MSRLYSRTKVSSIVTVGPGKIVIEGGPGTHISDMIEDAVELSNHTNKTIEFEFNGIKMDTSVSRDPSVLATHYAALCLKQREEYEKTPQFRREQEERVRELQAMQNKMDLLIGQIREKKDTMTEADVITWVSEFAIAADRVGIVYDKQEVVTFLENRGYQANDYVNDPLVKTNRKVFARWLIGQAIDCLKNGMPPHPGLTERFGKEYFARWQST